MELIEFLEMYGDRLVCAIISIVAFIVTLVRTGSISHALMESDMKYRSANYKPDTKQVFTNQRTDYKLNPVTNELEALDEKIDVQKEINSVKPSTIDDMLDAFLPQFPEAYKTAQAECRELVDDLYELGHALDIAEEYREKFGLSDDMTANQIFDYIGQRHNDLSAKLTELKKGEVKNEEVSQGNEPKGE